MTGADLKAFRDSLKFSQGAFAAHLGVAVEHLSRMERGHKPVGPMVERGAALIEILKLLGDSRTGERTVKVRQICQRALGVTVEPDFDDAEAKAA
jgi:transcriptional regulator with XRE-family HTH domain